MTLEDAPYIVHNVVLSLYKRTKRRVKRCDAVVAFCTGIRIFAIAI